MSIKSIVPSETTKALVEKFRQGSSILELMTEFGYGRKVVTRVIKENISDVEYKALIDKIVVTRAKKGALKTRGRPGKVKSEEWKKKIGDSQRGKKLSPEKIDEIKRRWALVRENMTQEETKAMYEKIVQTKRANGTFEKHSIEHSAWMKEHAPMRGKTMSDESRAKMSDAKRKFFESGGVPSRRGAKMSEEQRDECSERTKRMWAEGKFDYGR